MARTLSWGQGLGLTAGCFAVPQFLEQTLIWALPPSQSPGPWLLTTVTVLGFLGPALLYARVADVALPLGRPTHPRWPAWVAGAAFWALPFVLVQYGLALGLARLGVPRLSAGVPGVQVFSAALFTAQWVALALAPGVCEEVVFRGLVQPAFIERWGAYRGLAATVALFCACHIEPREVLALVPLAAALGLLAYRTRGIAASIMLHVAYNTWLLVLAYWGSFYEHYDWLVPWTFGCFVLGSLMLAPGGLGRYFARGKARD